MIKQLNALYDLHTHSTASDGVLSPASLVEAAHRAEVSCIALTDHDTVAGLDEGRQAAAKIGMSFVAGIELDIQWRPGEFHLLGLGLKSVSASMVELIDSSRRTRKERNEQIVELMRADGVDISLDELERRYPGRPIGRPHFADFLVEKGLARNRNHAFEKYMGRGRKWHVERTGANLDEAIQAIVDSGGIPVIAHPMSLYLSWGRMAEVLDDIKSRGVAGLEAWHSSAHEADCRRLEKMARERGFLLSAGSDYHGGHVYSSRLLGHTAGGHCITAALIDEALLRLIIPSCDD